MTDGEKVVDFAGHQGKSYNGGNGNGHNLHGRVSALEARLDYLAKKEDIQGLKVWILCGTIGGIIIAATMCISVLKLFG